MANDFLPFGTGAGANVITQSAYAALTARQTGFQSGVAQSNQLNKAWRQSSAMTAALGQYINDIGGLDALDDGNIPNLQLALQRTIQSGKMNFAATAGTTNAATVTLVPAPAAYFNGLSFVASITTSLATNATMNVNGLGAVQIVRHNGTVIQGNDHLGGDVACFTYFNGKLYTLGLVRSDVPGLVNSSTAATLFIRTDGSNSNNGATNSPSGAFQTIQSAIDYAYSNYGLGRAYDLRIGIAGNYAAPNSFPRGSNITLTGNTATPGSFVITSSAVSAFDIGASTARIVGVNIRNDASNGRHFNCYDASTVTLQTCQFTSTVTPNTYILSTAGATVSLVGTMTFASNANSAISVSNFGFVIATSTAVLAYSGTPTYGTANFLAQDLGVISCFAPASVTGSAVGPRFIVRNNALIQTAGAGATFIPGTVAGTTATGGQYV